MVSSTPKRIVDHTVEELDEAVTAAIEHCQQHGLHFYKVLHGIDAYMERRARRDAEREAAESARIYNEVMSDPWGNS